MFHLRPNATWQMQGQMQGVKPFRGSAEQKAPVSSMFFTLSPRQKAQRFKASRRASDALGPRAPMPVNSRLPFFVNSTDQTAQPGRLIMEYGATEWISPEESQQLVELNDSADGMMSELSQIDRDLGALSAQAATGTVTADLSLTAQQTFTRIDALMQRWSLRAEEVERAHTGTQWVAFNPVTGNKLQQIPLVRRAAQRQSTSPAVQSKAIAPKRNLPGTAHTGNQRQPRYDFAARPLAPAVQIRHSRLRLSEKYDVTNTKKLTNLRQQMNQMAAIPAQMNEKAGGLRRIALARLASLHTRIDHMAHELHDHRQHIEFSIQQRMDRRRAPRNSFLPTPVLKPKTKGETTS